MLRLHTTLPALLSFLDFKSISAKSKRCKGWAAWHGYFIRGYVLDTAVSYMYPLIITAGIGQQSGKSRATQIMANHCSLDVVLYEGSGRAQM